MSLLSAGPQGVDAKYKRDEGGEEQCPRDDLVPRERVAEPDIHIEKEKDEDRFPGEETIKAMRARLTKRLPRNRDDENRSEQEDDPLSHVTSEAGMQRVPRLTSPNPLIASQFCIPRVPP